MNIEPAVRELAGILAMEIRSFSTLHELLILEEKGLVECDRGLLAQTLGRQEDVLSSIACLEKSRVDTVSRIEDALGMEAGGLTVSSLAERLDEPQRRELRDAAHVLAGLQKNLKRRNVTNALIIRQGAAMVEGNLRFLMRRYGKPASDPGTYTAGARSGQVSGSIGLDGRM
jgi:hypothetical protein